MANLKNIYEDELFFDLSSTDTASNFQQIEKKLKRNKNSHMKPRTIDIDIVFFDNEKINTSKLKIPHYDWQNRDFFIKPLKEINCQAEEFKNFRFA